MQHSHLSSEFIVLVLYTPLVCALYHPRSALVGDISVGGPPVFCNLFIYSSAKISVQWLFINIIVFYTKLLRAGASYAVRVTSFTGIV